ncbi:hypothetical protein HZC30_00510 [Candidatus Woesearchaeota archaeon]|nr:hypothetical protein [Candidatus Woesearchaeota archaeon]
MAWNKIGTIVIAVVVMLILWAIYFPSGGMFDNLKELVKGVAEYAPNVSIGMNELNASGVALPGEQGAEVSALKSAIEGMLSSNKTNCFGSFGGFESELGNSDKSTNINIYYNNDPQSMKIVISNQNGQVYKIFNFNNTHPCVIAGRSNEAKNFYAHYIDGEQLVSPYSSTVQGLTIFYQKEWTSYNGNTIRVMGWPEDGPVNDEGNNFDNSGLLFKGGGNEICFFPTNKHINADDDGIEDDYVKQLKEDGANLCS